MDERWDCAWDFEDEDDPIRKYEAWAEAGEPGEDD